MSKLCAHALSWEDETQQAACDAGVCAEVSLCQAGRLSSLKWRSCRQHLSSATGELSWPADQIARHISAQLLLAASSAVFYSRWMSC